MQKQLEEMFTVALILMAGLMAVFVVYMMVTYETEPLGMAIQVAVILALGLILMGECYHEHRLIKERKKQKGDDEQ